MRVDEIRRALDLAHRGRYAVCVRAVNPSGNTVDIVGFVMAIGGDGGIRFCEGDPVSGLVHDFPARSVLRVKRVHGA